MKELFTVEYDFLDDALDMINSEFGSWEIDSLGTKNQSVAHVLLNKFFILILQY